MVHHGEVTQHLVLVHHGEVTHLKHLELVLVHGQAEVAMLDCVWKLWLFQLTVTRALRSLFS